MKNNNFILALTEVISELDYKEIDLNNTKSYKKLITSIKTLSDTINEKVDDFRLSYLVKYRLDDLLVTIFFAVMQGCDKYSEIYFYAKDQHKFLKKFTSYKTIPSHDTFRRLLMNINTSSLHEALLIYINDAFKLAKTYYNKKNKLKHISVDGKTLNGSGRLHKTNQEIKNMGLLNVYETDLGINLLSKEISDKTNESVIFREVAPSLDFKNTVVSLDAIHCQKETVGLIINKKGHYVIGLKGNQKDFYEEASKYFLKNENKLLDNPNNYLKEELEKNGIKITRREYFMFNASSYYNYKDWHGLKKIVCVRKTIIDTLEDTTTYENRFYITSLNKLDFIANTIRKHWQIENNLHWHLDVSMKEDESLIVDRTAATNFSTIRKVSLTFLKIMKTVFPEKGVSISLSRKRIGWNPDLNMIRLFDFLGNDDILKRLENI